MRKITRVVASALLPMFVASWLPWGVALASSPKDDELRQKIEDAIYNRSEKVSAVRTVLESRHDELLSLRQQFGVQFKGIPKLTLWFAVVMGALYYTAKSKGVIEAEGEVHGQ